MTVPVLQTSLGFETVIPSPCSSLPEFQQGVSRPTLHHALRQGLVASDEERLARFEREAKLLASPNNANIAAIYGLEEDNGARFLVLELVEGDTLADRRAAAARPRPRWRATRI